MPNIFNAEVLDQFLELAPELETHLRQARMNLEPSNRPPFNALVESVLYQQLALKAAQTIHRRLIDLVGTLSPSSILRRSQEELRGVGLSRQKALYLHNIAEAFSEGGFLEAYSDPKNLEELSSEEIVKLFSNIKGIGEWSVQMFLIFSVGRLDVLSPNDLGVRKGVMKLYDLQELPTPSRVKELARNWHPLETVGNYLAWRALDE